MQGIVTQVFDTGDFSIWAPESKRLVMAYTTICDVAVKALKPGAEVVFSMQNDRVVSVADNSGGTFGAVAHGAAVQTHFA